MANSDRNPALEAAIFANPTDLDAWSVYGDWLQTQGDPRGELVALEVAKARGQDGLQEKIDALVLRHRAEWLGPMLAEELEKEGEAWQGHVLDLEWRFGFLWRAKVRTIYDWEGPTVLELLRALLDASASRFLFELSIGLTDAEGETEFSDEIRAVAEVERPSLRRVYVGDFEFPDETEISWTEVGDVSPLYVACPNLEWLKVQGGGIELGTLAHPKLKALTVHTGGLPEAAVRSIAQADLPNLTDLEVWFGDDNYGAGGDAQTIAPLFTGQGVPKLVRLGLMNAQFSNDLPAALAGSPLLKQIRLLDLSMGVMSSDGATALLEHADAFAHLERLAVDDNMLSEDEVERLRARFGGALVSREQKEYEPDWLYVSVGE